MNATAKQQLSALAIVCDRAGTVVKVLYDGLGITAASSSVQTLVELVDDACDEKARAFLYVVQQEQAAFGWELNFAVDGEIKLLHFVGCVTEEGLLLAGATTHVDLANVCERLECLRQLPALKPVIEKESGFGKTTDQYDEITLLNSELLTLQRQLVKRTIELEQMNEQKNEFIGIAAHDLRNPLQVIDGYSRLLLRESFGPLTAQQHDMVSAISRNSDFMLRLITDLLHISCIEAGNLQLDLKVTNLVELTRKNIELNRLLAQQKEIELVFSCDENQLTILIDPSKIEQVLNNLLQNAIKFSHSRTVVTVRLNRTAHDAVILVTDQGQGIPPNEMDQLFKPFQRTSVRSTADEPSTGLGLAIVKRIVIGHGGEIWAESQPGSGSTFYVRLPLRTNVREDETEPH